MITFDEFKSLFRKMESDPRVEMSPKREFSDYDIAVLWAVSKIGEKNGYPCEMTIDEIWNELPEQFRKDET